MSSLISSEPDGLQNTSRYPYAVASGFQLADQHKSQKNSSFGKLKLLRDGVEDASFLSLILKILDFRYYDPEYDGILFL